MNFPGIAILSVALLPVALALVWCHRFAVSYRSRGFNVEFDDLAEDSVMVQAAKQPASRYVPPKAPRDRDYAVSVLSEAGF
jgi:hypothetical protein